MASWDIGCIDEGIDTLERGMEVLGEIIVNWTILGLEDAMLEAVSHVYENYLGSPPPISSKISVDECRLPD